MGKIKLLKKKADRHHKEREEVYSDGELIGVIIEDGDGFEFLVRRYNFKPEMDRNRGRLLKRIQNQVDERPPASGVQPSKTSFMKTSMDENEWLSDFVFNKHVKGVTLRDILKSAKMWGYDLSYVKRAVKKMLTIGNFLNVKGRIYPGRDEYGREMDKIMYAGELLKIARDMVSASNGTFYFYRSSVKYRKSFGGKGDLDEFLKVLGKGVASIYGERLNVGRINESEFNNRGTKFFEGDVRIESPQVTPLSHRSPQEEWDRLSALAKFLRKNGYKESSK